MIDKESLLLLSAIVWKYGEVFVDDNEIEYHVIKLAEEEFLDFGYQALEVYHKEGISYYGIKRII